MSESPVFGSRAPRSLFGALRSWLQTQRGEAEDDSSVPYLEIPVPNVNFAASPRVLIADDNPVNVMLMSGQLALRGLLPLQAADGAEAVALASEQQFDLILMDLQMPVLDGLGATAAIRRFEAEHSRTAVPVLAYSSTCPSAVVLARHGLNGSLRKPCDGTELDACLALWCPTYRAASSDAGNEHHPWQTRSRPAVERASIR